jgi:glycosyltransferase involved in cell wall biosynthesis
MKPRVCYYRGSFLNPFEAQYLEPLADQFDLTVANSRSHRYDVSGIGLPRIELPCVDYINGNMPRRISGKSIPNLMRLLGYEDMVWGLDRHLEMFDLMHVPEQSFYSTWQIATRKAEYGFKLITVQDEVNPFWYLTKPAIARRVKEVRRATDLFIARTERAKAALICEGVDPANIRVIGHGVDQARFYPASRNESLCRELGVDPGRFIILFVGNLYWTKGVYALANAAKLLLLDRKISALDPLFIMVGVGDEQRGMEAALRQMGIHEAFLFLGQRPYHELPDLHRLADIFVLPSISSRYVLEQFGIVLIESMATGTPVVSTYCGSIDEVVGDAGLLVQANDYYRLHEALDRLCKDDKLREELGAKGLRRVGANFSSQVIASKIAAAYCDVLSI